MRIQAYKDLKIWKECEMLATEISACTHSFEDRDYEPLGEQLRDESRAVLFHIAEGFKQGRAQDRANFFNRSRSSLFEVEAQWLLTSHLDLVPKIESDNVCAQLQFCKKLLNCFIAHYSKL